MPTFEQLREFTRRGAKHYGIDPSLAFALFEAESNWNHEAVSPKGALGIAQLMPETASGLGIKDPRNPWDNIDGGLRYLKQQLDKYKDPSLAIAAYNAGPGAVDAANGIPQNKETPAHVANVMRRQGEISKQIAARLAKEGKEQIESTEGFLGVSGAEPVARTVPSTPKPITDAMSPDEIRTQTQLQAAGLSGNILPIQASGLLGFAPEYPVENPIADAANRGWARGNKALMQPLAAATEWLRTNVPGLKRDEPGIFEQSRDLWAKQEARYPAGQMHPVAEALYSGIFGFPQMAAEWTGNIPWASFKGLTEGGVTSALGEGLKRYTIGELFKFTHPETMKGIAGETSAWAKALQDMTPSQLSREYGKQVAGAGLIGGADALVSGGRPEDVAQAALEMALLRATGGQQGPVRGPRINYEGELAYERIDKLRQQYKTEGDARQGQIYFTEQGIPTKIIANNAPEGSSGRRYMLRVDFKQLAQDDIARVLRGFIPMPETTITPTITPPTSEEDLTGLRSVPPTLETERPTPTEPEAMRLAREAGERRKVAIEEQQTKGREAAERIVKFTLEKAQAAADHLKSEYRLDYEPYETTLRDRTVYRLRPSTYGNRVDIAESERAMPPEDLPKAERDGIDELLLDDKIVEMREGKEPNSFDYIAQQLGITPEDAAARYEYAVGTSDYKPYEATADFSHLEQPKGYIESPGVERLPTDPITEQAREKPVFSAPEKKLVGWGLENANGFKSYGEALRYKIQRGWSGVVEKQGNEWWVNNGVRPKSWFFVSEGTEKDVTEWKGSGDVDLMSVPLWSSRLFDFLKKPEGLANKTRPEEFIKLMDRRAKTPPIRGFREEWEDMKRMTGLMAALKEWEGKVIPKQQLLDIVGDNLIEVDEVIRREGTPLKPKYADTQWSLPYGEEDVELILTSKWAQALGGDTAHFEEGKGVYNVGWIRGKVFTDHRGLKFFHIDEVQSNRHQKANRKRQEKIKRLMEPHPTDELLPKVKHKIETLEQQIDSHRNRLSKLVYEASKVVRGSAREARLQYKDAIREAGLTRHYTVEELNSLPEEIRVRILQLKDVAQSMDKFAKEWYISRVASVEEREIRTEIDTLVRRRSDLTSDKNSYISEPGLSREEAEKQVPEGVGYAGREAEYDVEGGWRSNFGIPDAPFRKSWPTLLLRRAIRWAAEEGYDGVTWTTGEQQMKRNNAGLRDIMFVRQTASRYNVRDSSGRKIMQAESREAAEREVELRRQHGVDSPTIDEVPGDINLRTVRGVRTIDSDSPEADELRRLLGDRASQLPKGIDLSTEPLMIGGKGLRGFYGSLSKEGQWAPTKSVIETSFRDAAEPFKVKTELVKASKAQLTQREAKNLQDAIRAETDVNTKKALAEYQRRLTDVGGPIEKASISEWSVQPGLTFTPEMKKTFSERPMMLYSMSPIYFNAKNLKALKRQAVAESLKEGEVRDIGRLYASDDITWLTRVMALPQWIAQENPRLRGVFDAVYRADAKVQENLFKALSWGDTWVKASKDTRERVTNNLVRLDAGESGKGEGVPYEKLGITEARYQQLDNGDIQLNSKHHVQYHEAMLKRGMSAEDAALATEMRAQIDQILVAKWNFGRQHLRKGTEALEALKEEVFGIPNYFPHNRKGQFALGGWTIGEDGQPVKVADFAFELPMGMYTAQAGLEKVSGKRQGVIEGWARKKLLPKILEDPALEALGIKTWQIERRPADAIQSYGNHPTMLLLLNDILGKVVDKVPKEFRKQFETVLTQEAKDLVEKRGNWGHWAKRRGVYGYDVDDAGRILYDYFQGFYHMMGKAEMLRELGAAVKHIDLGRPQETKWAADYISSMLEPGSSVSGALHKLRTLAYLKYINPMKYFFVNTTNAVTAGVPMLGTYTDLSAEKYFLKNYLVSARWIGTKKGLSGNRERLIKELYDSGILRAQFFEQVGRALENTPGNKLMGKWANVKSIYNWPASSSEIMSRVATALAAYDSYMDGKLNKGELASVFKGGREKLKNPTEEQFQEAKRFAEMIVNKSHSIFGEMGRPEWARRGTGGKLLGSALIFRHYQQNIYHMWREMAINGGAMGRYALARSLLATAMLGGMKAIPLAYTFNKFYQWLIGDEDGDLWTKAQKYGLLGTWATHGLPASLGFDVSNSFDMDIDWDPADIFGVMGSFVTDVRQTYKAASKKDWQKAMEYAVPLKVARDGLFSTRLATTGLTSIGGKPINWLQPPKDAVQKDPNKPWLMSQIDMLKQTSGFVPMELTRIRSAKREEIRLQDLMQSKQDELTTRYVNARLRGDRDGMAIVFAEANEWNKHWLQKGVPSMTLRLRDSIKARMRPQKPPKRMRRKAREIEEAWQ